MKPNNTFVLGLETHVLRHPSLVGFRFRRPQLELVRSVKNNVCQSISFQLSRWNSVDECEFWSTWKAVSPQYSAWLQSEWQETPTLDALGGLVEWNIPGWSRQADRHFALRNQATDSDEWREFLENVQRVGIPFLDRISTWQGAAEELVRERWHFDAAADFYVIAGETERAVETLRDGIRAFESGACVDNFGELPRLKARLERYSATA